ncbi:NAD(P)-dependent iron-only hydrogenase diaphorase component iron-sulfur protein [Hypnocyclicus thermotrophus]|uniref:NAD(P)-dependent iron-only hydrogenase diaphorase component iron-sulfur protein n=1 Tax=Hypnocyclicus thermotrophus TaxID=1627895 RepID=A0AA46I4R8_9FUSO|nr:NAD(P)H-dependent oxidoreductase subunit E [Hypnocyclicus thermotrophus]TDT67426.1 NAD(P)-dependent iron-only hydrogenase diaphorase component iron-sulfur protein [Hypnocyclicus thermotrophus]
MKCTNQVKDSCFRELKDFIDSLETKKGELITVLHKAQEIFGYLPVEVQEFVSEELNIPLSEVYGVISFYSFFTTTPKGEHPISVCMGTACYVNGSEKILDELKRELGIKVGETTQDGKFSLDVLRCVGACGMAPVMLIGKKTYGRVTADEVKNILKEYK